MYLLIDESSEFGRFADYLWKEKSGYHEKLMYNGITHIQRLIYILTIIPYVGTIAGTVILRLQTMVARRNFHLKISIFYFKLIISLSEEK